MAIGLEICIQDSRLGSNVFDARHQLQIECCSCISEK